MATATAAPSVALLDPTAWKQYSDALNHSNDVWMGWPWLGSWWEAFGQNQRLWLLAGHDALCPLVRRWRRGFRQVRFPGSVDRRHSLPHGTVTQFAHWLALQPGWDWIQLTGVPADQAEIWACVLRACRHFAHLSPPWQQRYLNLDRPWAQVEADMSRSTLQNLRRRLRNLQASHRVGFALHTSEADVARHLDVCMAIEASGWKGAAGTAMASDVARAAFYRNVVCRAAARGQAFLTMLLVDEAPVAFELALARGLKLGGLKIGFDPAWREYGPGLMVQYWTLHQAHIAGYHSFDFSGADSDHKARWSRSTHAFMDLTCFRRNIPGQALRQLHRWRHATFGAVPPPLGECATSTQAPC